MFKKCDVLGRAKVPGVSVPMCVNESVRVCVFVDLYQLYIIVVSIEFIYFHYCYSQTRHRNAASFKSSWEYNNIMCTYVYRVSVSG